MSNYIIAVDAMGGDNAPSEIVQGSILALQKFPDIHILLCGPQTTLTPLLESTTAPLLARIEILDAPDTIDIHESPMIAVRKKVNSSLVQAMLSVKDNRAQAVVSAGSTGAILAGGVMRIGRIPGIDRPALSPLVPGRKKPFLLLDAGANVDCQPDYLEQFGLMGSIYMKQVMGIETPNVCLANIGEEAEKGDKLTKEAHQMMSAQTAYHFGGNIEAREFPSGKADVIVCDGFVGNIILKYSEGLADALVGMLKESMMKNLDPSVLPMLKPVLGQLKDVMNYEEHGGAPLLGVKGGVIKAHGSSNAKAIMNAIGQARRMITGNVVQLIEQGLSQLSSKKDANETGNNTQTEG